MSSSYLSLKNLEERLEVYIETFNDHDNRLDVGYRALYGLKILSLIFWVWADLLWPLVVLMLQSQAQWCPGWMFGYYIPAVKAQLTKFVAEMENDILLACPRLNKHRLADIRNIKYGRCELVEGWLVVEDANRKPLKLNSGKQESQKIASTTLSSSEKASLQNWNTGSTHAIYHSTSCYTTVWILVYSSLEYAVHGRPISTLSIRIKESSSLEAEKFKRCVQFVAQLPNVQEKNMEFSDELSSAVFWRLKSTLIEVVWEKLFLSHFPKLFRRVEKVVEDKQRKTTL